MTRTTRWRVTGCLLLALLMLPPELLVLRAIGDIGTPTPEAWVARMSREELTEAAERIVDYPREYRRAILAALPASGRATVWRTTIDTYLATHTAMSASTRALLVQARQFATSATFIGTNGPPTRLREIENRLRMVMSHDDVRALFVTAGPEPTPERSNLRKLPFQTRLHSYLRGRFIAQAAESCNCYTSYPPDCTSPHICSELHDCDFWYIGCGIWNMEPCNGYCHTPI